MGTWTVKPEEEETKDDIKQPTMCINNVTRIIKDTVRVERHREPKDPSRDGKAPRAAVYQSGDRRTNKKPVSD